MQKLVKILLLGALLAFLLPFKAEAALPNCDSQTAINATITCCKNLPGKFYKIENCIRNIFRVSANNTYITGTTNALRTTFGIVATFAVVILGFKMATGGLGNRTYSESVMLLIKIAFISGFMFTNTFSAGGFMNAITNIGIDISGIVTGPLLGGGSIWEQADMIIDGLTGNPAGVPMGSVYLIIVLVMLGLLFAGPFGLMLISLIITVILGFFIVFASAIYTAFLCMFAIYILMLFSPLFMPLVIFNPQTYLRNLFEQWLKLVINYTLHLIIFYFYIALMITIIASIVGIGTFFGPNTIVGMLASAPVGVCTLVDFILFKINIPCIMWSMADVMKFGTLILLCVILAYTAYQFLKKLPELINRLVGDLSGVNFSGQALGSASSIANVVKGGAMKVASGEASASAKKAIGNAREKIGKYIGLGKK